MIQQSLVELAVLLSAGDGLGDKQVYRVQAVGDPIIGGRCLQPDHPVQPALGQMGGFGANTLGVVAEAVQQARLRLQIHDGRLSQQQALKIALGVPVVHALSVVTTVDDGKLAVRSGCEHAPIRSDQGLLLLAHPASTCRQFSLAPVLMRG